MQPPQNSEHKHCCKEIPGSLHDVDSAFHKIIPPQRVDWKTTIVPEFSSIALLDEDSVDDYEMIDAVPFIEKLLATVEADARRREREVVIAEIEKVCHRNIETQDAYLKDGPEEYRSGFKSGFVYILAFININLKQKDV